MYVCMYVCMYMYMYKRTMKTGSLLVKMIELPTRLTRKLLQGSMFCATVIVIILT